ncbi:hypothetical protein [Mariprofundus ferrooxydans]|uniref:hypothetical protein n=1 Tax=Mariprofundus ferrooxydans TaxID=314344 RepID=UPI0014312419|nr:hypothetical protein [Mariprofundus ferrooxydans]
MFLAQLFNHMKMIEFSYVNDDGVYLEGQALGDVERNEYACGMYVFRKKSVN